MEQPIHEYDNTKHLKYKYVCLTSLHPQDIKTCFEKF